MRRKQLALTLAASMVAAASLSGCTTWNNAVNYIRADSESVCPDANVLANTSVIPVFDPHLSADPSNVVYTVKMSGVKSRCDFSKHTNAIDANMRIFFTATRPPGGEEVHYKVPYYVAVTLGGEIVDKQIHYLEFDFPKAVANFTGEEAMGSIVIPVARDKRSFEYHLLTGFQLTQAQIDYNKKVGQYLP
jgi:hypothetical protein